jgi:hypothetical protein
MSSAFQKKLFVVLALCLALQTAIGLVFYLLSLDAQNGFGGDFICFWRAGQRAHAGDFAAIYDPAGWRRALQTGAPKLTWFVYPPFSLFGLQFLGRLPYAAAVTWWSLVPLPFYVGLVLALARRSDAASRSLRPRQGAGLGWLGALTLVAMTSAFLAANLLCGQTGTILAVFLLAAAYFWPDRPLVAGVFIGLMAVKPQLGLLIPFALVGAGQWRAIVSATVTVATLVIASLAVTGAGLWTDYLRMTQIFGHFIGLGHGQFDGLAIGPYVSLLAAGVPITAATAVQAIVTLAVIVGIVVVFLPRTDAEPGGPRQIRLDLQLGILAAGSLLATPYALSYDTPRLALAVIPLLVRAWGRDWDGWALTAIAALAAAPYVQQSIDGRVPIGFCALLLAFAVLCRRCLREASDSSAGVDADPALAPAAAG